MFNRFRKDSGLCNHCGYPHDDCQCDNEDYCEVCGKHLDECDCEEVLICGECKREIDECICEDEIHNEEDFEEEQVYEDEICDMCGQYYEYCTCYEDRKSEWKRNLLMLILIALLVAVGWYMYTNFIKENKGFLSNEEQVINRAEEFINLVYNVEDADAVVKSNKKVLSYLDSNLRGDFDVADSEIYLARYGDFSNEAIDVTIDSTNSLTDESVMVRYTLETGLDIPSDRMAIITFNIEGLITNFEEFRIYPVIDNYYDQQ